MTSFYIYICLDITEEEAIENAKTELIADTKTYRVLNQSSFFHIMLDVLGNNLS